MNVEEYANLERVEREHWYYAGKREIVRHWLERMGAVRPENILLDCGAGTGLFARELRGRCQVRVNDEYPESLAILKQHFSPEEIVDRAIFSSGPGAGSCDAVTALDVLEHVKEDAAMVASMHHVLKPGGVAVVTVPASMALWSDWDVALHHHRRYDRPQLRALFPAGSWDLIELKYTNTVVYPAVWVVRKWRSFTRHVGHDNSAIRTEDTLPPAWLNRMLRWLFVGLAKSRVSLPFGVSLLLVARKRRGA